MSTWRIRAAGTVVAIAAWFYIPWLWDHLNTEALWLSIPFVLANHVVVAAALVAWINNWTRLRPSSIVVPEGLEATVAVLIPTYGEPAWMLRRTIGSVLDQDWPLDRLVVVVGDDAGSSEVETLVMDLARLHPLAVFHYLRPPQRGSRRRDGEAKAGNLNACLGVLQRHHPDVHLIETRDADDLVGDRFFLRRTVAQLLAEPAMAYVQTVKQAEVSPGDPFGNTDAMFYEGSMLARNAANAVFPCGSGLVWRKAALLEIGGFPAWNLVEDLQSGVEALRRGWTATYLPIVGAIGQHAPEDIPNVFKQRGTWALDTVRLLLWQDLSGLSLRQRLQFVELGLFYVLGPATILLALYPLIGLMTSSYPLVTTQLDYAVRFWPMVVAIELFLVALNTGQRFEVLWRARQMWFGLAPTYAVAVCRAIAYGPRRKPAYRVTRKHHVHGAYLREVGAHLALCALIPVPIVVALARGAVLEGFDFGSAYWAVISIVYVGSFLPKAWHGVGWSAVFRRPRPGAAGAAAAASAAAALVIDLRDSALGESELLPAAAELVDG